MAASDSGTSLLARTSSSLKPAMKEKFVAIYEEVFNLSSPVQEAREQGIAGRASLQRFWDELLLLKVNELFLARCIASEPEDRLTGPLKPTITDLFSACVRYLVDDNFIRVAHALETCSILLREILRKRFNEQGFTIITLVAGSADLADSFFRKLIGKSAELLARGDAPVAVKVLVLRLYLTILTATDNVNTNSIAAYFFVSSVFDPVVSALSARLPSDRSRLELDAALVLILLLQWKESPNIYSDRLCQPAAPLIPLLNSIHSLLLPAGFAPPSLAQNGTDSKRSSGVMGGLFGTSPTSSSPTPSSDPPPNLESKADVRDKQRCRSSAAVVLIYYLVHLSPVLKSLQAWRKSEDPSKTTPPTPNLQTPVVAVGQSLSFLWMSAFRAFLSLCWRAFRALPLVVDSRRSSENGQSNQMSAGQQAAVLRAKTCLTTLRIICEEPTIIEFLRKCDGSMLPAFPNSGAASTLPPKTSKSHPVLSIILDLATDVLSIPPLGSFVDADLYSRAEAVIATIVVSSRGQEGVVTEQGHGPQGSATQGFDWSRLWSALSRICEWSGDVTALQKPGVTDLAAQSIAILEYVLAEGQEILGSSGEVEALHASVMANCLVFQKLMQAAHKQTEALAKGTGRTGRDRRASFTGDFKMLNLSAVRNHYEVQIAAMGIRGVPSEQQALAGVQKKGTTGLRFKSKPAIAAHAYAEGTSESRVLNGLARALMAEHRRLFWPDLPNILESFA